MHGFGTGDFHFLEGLTLIQVCLGQFQTQLHFDTRVRISTEGRYIHRIAVDNRELIQEPSSCGYNELHRLLGATVAKAVVSSPNSLTLSFSNGDLLILVDDSQQYESFLIGSDGRLIII